MTFNGKFKTISVSAENYNKLGKMRKLDDSRNDMITKLFEIKKQYEAQKQ